MKLSHLILFILAFCAGCGRHATPKTEATSRPDQLALSDRAAPKESNRHDVEEDGRFANKAVTVVEHSGLHNLLQVSDGVYSGSQPEGDEGFASLAELGVKTVVSVDGARPDVETARKHGLRYVHIPIGYDGVPEKAGQALARLVQECEGLIYIHCHHGNHRGPAAAAVACIASGATDSKSALRILELAGTSKDYPGLWRDVEAYVPPVPDKELPELVEVAEVKSLAAAMAKMDRSYDLVKLCRDAQWSVPPKHPDIVPAQEALQLKEGLREIGRNLAADRDDRFKRWLADAEGLATALEAVLRVGDRAAATQQFQLLEKSCKQCHAQYRN